MRSGNIGQSKIRHADALMMIRAKPASTVKVITDIVTWKSINSFALCDNARVSVGPKVNVVSESQEQIIDIL
jgi:hypothetical protein